MDMPGTAWRDLVSDQWRAVETLEQMSATRARIVRAAELRAEHRRAVRALPGLEPWPLLPERSRAVYQSPADVTRAWRVCRLLSPDDRVLDIGIAHGWLSGMIARAVGPAYYAGVDLSDSRFDSVRQMAELNGLDTSAWFIGVKDLYDLSAEWVDGHRPTIVLLLEVLEHLPDPGRALKVIAESIPAYTQLLFSVPLPGRVESCWGHASVFDAERVRRLCAEAGFVVHWVEPVANTWQLLLVSRSAEPPARLARLGAQIRRSRSSPAVSTRRGQVGSGSDPWFHRVRLDPQSLAQPRWVHGVSRHDVRPDPDGGIRVTATATTTTGQHRAAVCFRVNGLRAVRVELVVADPTAVSGLFLEGRDEQGEVTTRWDLTLLGRRRLRPSPVTYVFRPGQRSAGFRATPPREPETTGVVELVLRVKPGAATSLLLRRAAYVR